jgi:DNA-binding beta-propeller fold protein YncE
MTRKTLARTATVIFAALLPLAAAPLCAQDGPYKILKTVKIGGEGGFDYLTADPANRTLYIARSGQGAHVGVYNLDTLAQVGDIPITGNGVHGAAVDDATGHGFATSKPITMFDAKTFKVIKTIDTTGNPDGYINDPSAHRFYVLSHSAPNVTVIDDKDGTVLGTIDLGGAPEEAQLDGKGKMYIDLEDKDAIAVVDTAGMKMVGKYDISSKGGGCAGLAMDTKNGILFAACRDKNNMISLSAADGHIITDLPIGVGCDGATFNPATMESFSSQGDGTLTVIKENSPTSFAVEQTVKTPVRAKTITLDPKTGHLYVATSEYGPIPAPPADAAPPAAGGPGGRFRGPRAPVIPGSFSIIVVGK